ncbi:M4 family metallopeptidase [Luteolibacter soli]|uniref:Neutral metalloproteinase n=1 Tax=Luteolibacter soli TaxID=3135280 RepID=A0ABU9AQ57_9BACT
MKKKQDISKCSPGLTQYSCHFESAEGAKVAASISAMSRRMVAGTEAHADPLEALDAESAARIHLDKMLASEKLPGLSIEEAAGRQVDFKSLGTQAIPFTRTTIVKFRQFVDLVPVFGSFIAIEVDEKNRLIAVDSSYTQPRELPGPIAKTAPADAVEKVRAAAKAKRGANLERPRLFYYFDSSKGKWQLAYIVENAPAPIDDRKPGKKPKGHPEPVVIRRSDYVIDAQTGKVIHTIARNFGVARSGKFPDDLGNARQIQYNKPGQAARFTLIDEKRKLRTHDCRFGDVDEDPGPLPGPLMTTTSNPVKWKPAAVSAHANAGVVVDFLRNTLRRDGVDDRGGELVSSINCISSSEPIDDDPQGYYNAFWNSVQMAYGQIIATVNGQQVRRSLACALDIVGHEIFHGVTEWTSDLVYERQSGALNESYSDIFGVMINNLAAGKWASPDRAKDWQWLIGRDVDPGSTAFRSMSRPKDDPDVAPADRQPNHFRDYRNLRIKNDQGGVHLFSGIPNYCAYLILTATDGAKRQHFTADEAAQLFYITLTARLNRSAGFSANRDALLNSARSLFRGDADGGKTRVAVIAKACSAVGI